MRSPFMRLPRKKAADLSIRHRSGLRRLNGKIEQLRNQNRKLDEENEHLVEMVRLPPAFIVS